MEQILSLDSDAAERTSSAQRSDADPGCRCDCYIVNLATGELRRGTVPAPRR